MKNNIKNEIDKKINEIRNKYNLTQEDTFDIVKLAKQNNIEVGNVQILENDIDGFFSVLNHSTVIGVNKNRKLTYKRYIIAYALGIYFFKYNGERKYAHIIDIDLFKNKIDWDLKYFVNSLLVPMESFSLKFEELKGKYVSDAYINQELARIYKVPVEVIEFRRFELEKPKNIKKPVKVRIKRHQ